MSRKVAISSVLRRALASGAAMVLVFASIPAEAKVGVAAAVNTDARGKPPGGAARVVTLGQTVVFNEQIITDGAGLVQILLLDGTTFTVGPNSQLTIDEFVYNPDTGDAKVVASVTKGAFRFIGGQTSRKAGGATIKTPVGTIGIRGAMVEGNVRSSSSATFSMVYGQQVTFTGSDGGSSRIYRPGYSLDVQQTGGGETETNVRPRSNEDAVTFQTALAGQPGQSGGASQTPTESGVAASPIVQVGSQQLPTVGIVPPDRPSPVESSKKVDVEESIAEIGDVTTDQVNAAIVESGAPARPADPVTPPQPPVPTPGPPIRHARVLTEPAEHASPFYPETYPAAGRRGLVGSNAQSDRVLSFVQQNGRLVAETAGFNLPDFTGPEGDSGLVRIDVSSGAFGPTGPLQGPVYAGVGDFAAYLLHQGTDPTKPVYSIFGTGTDIATLDALNDGTNLRSYSLTPDPRAQSSLPFFTPEIYGNPNNASSTGLLVLESGDSPNPYAKPLLTWLDISGTGANQKSAALVMADILDPTSGSFEALRRGSMRPGASAAAYNFRGGIAMAPGPDGSVLFGPDANHFVIGNGTDPANTDTYGDATYSGPYTGNPQDGYLGDGVFGTQHVGNLESKTPQAALSRTTRNVRGFMNGIAESAQDPDGYAIGVPAPSLSMEINPGNSNYIGANATLADLNDSSEVSALTVAFGVTLGSNGGSTFIDDNRFGATRAIDRALTRVTTDDGQNVQQREGSSAGSYILSGRSVPIPGFQHCADNACGFIDWGWWGHQVSVQLDDGSGGTVIRSDFVHLGTWVAGQIASAAQLPTNVVATYAGSVLGNITRVEGAAVSRYIASGTFGLTFDFNARAGAIQIANFDGFSLSGNVTDLGASADSLFLGTVSGSGAAGTVSGSFVNNGADFVGGVIGSLAFTATNVTGIGTIAGPRTGSAPADIVSARVLTSPIDYQTAFGETFTVAGSRGLVGSTPATDRIVSLSRFQGRYRSGTNQIDLPDLTAFGEAGLESINVTGFADGNVVGIISHAGRGDFTAYLLGLNGNPSIPYYILVGSGTPANGLEPLWTGTNIREYTLTQDLIRPVSVPFFASDLYGPFANVASTNLILMESNNRALHVGETNYDTKFFQSWIDISGSGENQKSAIGLYAPTLIDGTTAQGGFDGSRRGSFRFGALAGPAALRGAPSTIASGSGAEIFGPGAENFVLGASPSPADALGDSLLGPGFTGNGADGYRADGAFSTHHVADLISSTPQTTLTRTERSISGFMTGLGESSADGGSTPYVLSGNAAPNFTLKTDPLYNSFNAGATVTDVFDTDAVAANYLLSFGFIDSSVDPGGPGINNGGDTTFVDDNRFGAEGVINPAYTRLRTDGGQDLAHSASSRNGSYIVSGRATPVGGYQHCTTCTFLDWGWWGTRVRVDASGAEIPTQRTDFVHMGTWVGGDIANDIDLPTTGSATYAGTALGNVARQTASGTAKYIAAGTMDMSFDFGTRTGNMTISNFDGITASGLISEAGTTPQALFAGTFSGAGVAGSVDGAFVRDGAANPTAGVIGQFGLNGTGFSATGTIAGARVP